MDIFRKPEVLKLDGNMAENFKRFSRQLNNFIKATGYDKKSTGERCALLLNLIGDDAFELLDTLDIKDEDKEKFDEVLKAYEKYCTPKKNIVYERFVFYTRKQKEAELFDHFYADIRKLVRNCDFVGGVEAEQELIRDRLVLGTCHTELQEQLIRMTTPTLENVVLKSKLYERNIEHTKEIQNGAPEARMVEVVRQKEKSGKNVSNQMRQKQYGGAQNQKIKCKFCNLEHKKGQCPAYGKKCNVCHRRNHFSSVCYKRAAVNVIEDDQSAEMFYIDTINLVNSFEKCCKVNSIESWYQIIKIENFNVKLKLDTGASVNILPLRIFKILNKQNNLKLIKTEVTLEAFGGFKIEPLGLIRVNCSFRNINIMLNFIVADGNVNPILGLSACMNFGLVGRIDAVEMLSREQFVQQYSEVFNGLGELKVNQKLDIKSTAIPKAKPPRRIPLKLNGKVKDKLQVYMNRPNGSITWLLLRSQMV